jgi:pimeloyl-ACP methyl ester carboxylesterase
MNRLVLSLLVMPVATATGCLDLDSFVMNPRHCSIGYSDDDCAIDKLCTPCGDDYPFADFGIDPALATRHPITLDDGETNDAWFIAAAPGAALADVTVVFSHGNFASLEHYLNRVALLWRAGVNVFALDYRGFGQSSDAAEASEAQFMSDTAAAWQQIPAILAAEGKESNKPVALYGYSAGALSGVEMAVSQAPADGGGVCTLILEAPWPSVDAFARDSTFIGVPGSFLSDRGWDNISKIQNYSGSYLHLHGTDDLTVRQTLGRELFDAAGTTAKRFVSVEGAEHGNFIAGVDEVGVDPDVPAVLGEEAYLDLIVAQLADCAG